MFSESRYDQKSIEILDVFEIKKRGLLQIVGEILESLKASPIRKTHISFKCNLDSRTISKYITMMESISLIEKSATVSSHYQITQKGLEYLEQFHSFMNLLDTDKIKMTQYHDQLN